MLNTSLLGEVSALAAASDVMLLTTSAGTIGDRVTDKPFNRTYQATVTGTGAVSATVRIEASNDLVGWVELGTISPTGTTMASSGIVSQTMWRHVRAVCTAISGTGASVKVTMGSGSL